MAWELPASGAPVRRLCGCDYGYRALLGVAVLHLPLLRVLFTLVREKKDGFRKSRKKRFTACAHAFEW